MILFNEIAHVIISLKKKDFCCRENIEKLYNVNRLLIVTYYANFIKIIKFLYSLSPSRLFSHISSIRIYSCRSRKTGKDFILVASNELRAPIQPVLGLDEILHSRKKVDTKE